MWMILFVVLLWFIWFMFIRDPVEYLQVLILMEDVLDMWTPVSEIEVGDSCIVKVQAVKKSGKTVELGVGEVTISDGDAVSIADGVVTGVGEGVAQISAVLNANPAIFGEATLTVTDPVVSLSIELGKDT